MYEIVYFKYVERPQTIPGLQNQNDYQSQSNKITELKKKTNKKTLGHVVKKKKKSDLLTKEN